MSLANPERITGTITDGEARTMAGLMGELEPETIELFACVSLSHVDSRTHILTVTSNGTDSPEAVSTFLILAASIASQLPAARGERSQERKTVRIVTTLVTRWSLFRH